LDWTQPAEALAAEGERACKTHLSFTTSVDLWKQGLEQPASAARTSIDWLRSLMATTNELVLARFLKLSGSHTRWVRRAAHHWNTRHNSPTHWSALGQHAHGITLADQVSCTSQQPSIRWEHTKMRLTRDAQLPEKEMHHVMTHTFNDRKFLTPNFWPHFFDQFFAFSTTKNIAKKSY
jgi:hypothetical protein